MDKTQDNPTSLPSSHNLRDNSDSTSAPLSEDQERVELDPLEVLLKGNVAEEALDKALGVQLTRFRSLSKRDQLKAIVELESNVGFALVYYLLKAEMHNLKPDLFESADSHDGLIKKEFAAGQYNGFSATGRKYLEARMLLQYEVKELEKQGK